MAAIEIQGRSRLVEAGLRLRVYVVSRWHRALRRQERLRREVKRLNAEMENSATMIVRAKPSRERRLEMMRLELLKEHRNEAAGKLWERRLLKGLQMVLLLCVGVMAVVVAAFILALAKSDHQKRS